MMLSHLVPNTIAQILSVDGNHELKLHLMELGFVPGTQIELISSTPFGDPSVYRIRGADIALRKNMADMIDVIEDYG